MEDLYVDTGEEISPNAPKPWGKPFQINVFVNSDHAEDRATHISQTWITLYCNSSPIIYYYKRQNTVESSNFGAEFVEFLIVTELILSLRYKLGSIGVSIEGAAKVFCDNESMYKNDSFAESELKKNHKSISFQEVR